MKYEGIRSQFCCNRIVYTLFMYVVSRKAIDGVFVKFHFCPVLMNRNAFDDSVGGFGLE